MLDFLEKATELNNNINKILVVAENYPELKASEQYLNLQKNLSKVESQLQAARRIYNKDVTNYNTKIESIPNNIIAAVFGFKKAKLFQIEEYKKENIKNPIDFLRLCIIITIVVFQTSCIIYKNE